MSLGTQLAAYDLGKTDENERIHKIIYEYFKNNMDECMDDYYELEKLFIQDKEGEEW